MSPEGKRSMGIQAIFRQSAPERIFFFLKRGCDIDLMLQIKTAPEEAILMCSSTALLPKRKTEKKLEVVGGGG